jgi:hypothetical protein
MTWIQTYTGRQVHIPPRDASEICIEDIAHHLAMTCRFQGACHQFYSVAEHSVRLLEATQALSHDPGQNRIMPISDNLKRWVLLHDAHEAYLGDTPRPIKRDLLMYEDGGTNRFPPGLMQDHFDAVIREAFSIVPLTANETDWLKLADGAMLATEARDLMAEPPAPWEALPAPLATSIVETEPPERAEAIFLGPAEAMGLR